MDRTDALIERFGVEAVTEACRPMLSDERLARIEAVLDARLASLTVVLENLHDPHNGAAAVRSVEAMGGSALHVVEGTEAFQFSAGVTIGCEKWVEIRRWREVDACVARLKADGFAVWAAVPGAAVALEDLDVSGPVAVLFGNERDGLTDRAVAAADGAFSIPMRGFTQSFNLSVSVAISVYSLANRRRRALGRAGDLDGQERARLRARWYAQDVRGVEEIVRRYVSG